MSELQCCAPVLCSSPGNHWSGQHLLKTNLRMREDDSSGSWLNLLSPAPPPQTKPEPRPPAGAPLAAPVAGREPASPKNTWNCCAPPSRRTRTLESASGRVSLKPPACRSHAYRYDVGQLLNSSLLADRLKPSELPG